MEWSRRSSLCRVREPAPLQISGVSHAQRARATVLLELASPSFRRPAKDQRPLGTTTLWPKRRSTVSHLADDLLFCIAHRACGNCSRAALTGLMQQGERHYETKHRGSDQRDRSRSKRRDQREG